jgi:hypothetical protein
MAKDKVSSEIALYITKYLDTRSDISDMMKKVLCRMYKSDMHTSAEWKEIVDRRIAKPAV